MMILCIVSTKIKTAVKKDNFSTSPQTDVKKPLPFQPHETSFKLGHIVGPSEYLKPHH